MIHIQINDAQLLQIKQIWCKWFFKNARINDFLKILDTDTAFRQLIFQSTPIYLNWKKERSNKKEIDSWQKPIVDYFFSDLSNENTILNYSGPFNIDTQNFFIKNYDSFRNSKAFESIINIMNLQVCPYCNRNFIESYVNTDNKRRKFYFKGDLDHHYSKSNFPILALSFYNLIPCCKVCNHEKSSTSQHTFYPYYDYEDEYCFNIELYKTEKEMDIINDIPIPNIYNKIYDSTVWQGISNNFQIKLSGKNGTPLSPHMENSKEIFKLEKKYNHSKDYVKELIRKKYIYPNIKKEEIFKNFKDIFTDEDELQETFYSYTATSENLSDRPLSKLTKDILEQLKILDN